MSVSITLTGGQSVIAYLTPTGGVDFDELDGSLDPQATGTTVAQADASWVNAQALASGGFTVEWRSSRGLMAQDFNAAGAAIDLPYTEAQPPPLALAGFASNAQGSVLLMPGGGFADGTQFSPYAAMGIGSAGYLQLQLFGPAGAQLGSTFESGDTGHFGTDTEVQLTPLASGGYLAGWVDSVGAFSPFEIDLKLQAFTSAGAAAGASPVDIRIGLPAYQPFGGYAVSGLADGGFVAAWVSPGAGVGAGEQLSYQEFTASGAAVGSPVVLGAAGNTAPTIDALADGRYVISWTGPAGPEHVALNETGAALGLATPPDPGSQLETLAPAGAAVPLTASADFTAAVVLSDHVLAAANTTTAPWGGPEGAVQTWDTTGTQTGSASLPEFASAGQALSPQLAALPGGFFEVSYTTSPYSPGYFAGGTDYQIYNSQDQLVFDHNAFTNPNLGFAPLLNGGYLVTNSGSNVFGLVDPSGTTSWLTLPADAAGTPQAQALQGGGFAFTYAGSTHFDVFDAAGRQTGAGDLGASMSNFAKAFAPLAGGGFAEAWLSPDGGQNGLATSLDVQTFDASGNATSAAVTVMQDLDPWHTQIQLQAHADGSVAMLWSQGGALWGTEVANGAAGPAYAAGVALSLSNVDAIQLTNDRVGLAFLVGENSGLQFPEPPFNGETWAEIFDPSTGVYQQADLGAGVSDLHALATAGGGLAASWKDNSGAILGSVLNAAGQAGPPVTLPGDLLGVDANGLAIAAPAAPPFFGASVTPALQHYALNDGGLFWAA